MSIELNDTIVYAHDKHQSATFLADILGIPVSEPVSHFVPVMIERVALDFDDRDEPFTPQHHAFLVGDDIFDAAFARLCNNAVPYWADPQLQQPGKINHRHGGRGVLP